MKKSKGFTLVELVIVIAVIAILAGVMIGVFAGVVKSAKESAKLQELKNQEIAQKAEDILAKVDNANWLGWEDLETKIASAVQTAANSSNDKLKTDMPGIVTAAVDEAIAKYAASSGSSNTGITQEQMKAIIESAINGSYTGVTEAQVKTIVNNAVANNSTITKSQVQSIVENVVTAAQAKNLTLAQVSGAVTAIVKAETPTDAQIQALINTALKDYAASTITEEQITNIIAKYFVGSEAKGDFSWYDPSETVTAVTLDTKDKLLALPAIVNSGDDMAGTTITLSADAYDVSADAWTPIGSSSTNPFKGTIEGKNGGTTIELNSKDYKGEWFTTTSNHANGFAWGLIGYCDKDVTFENINLEVDCDLKDGLCVGGFIGYVLGQSPVNGQTGEYAEKTITFTNCTVTGKLKAGGKMGGFIGNAYGFVDDKGTPKETADDVYTRVNINMTNCISDVEIVVYGENNTWFGRGSGFIGYTSNSNITTDNCTFTGSVSKDSTMTGYLRGSTFGIIGGKSSKFNETPLNGNTLVAITGETKAETTTNDPTKVDTISGFNDNGTLNKTGHAKT